MRIVMIGSGYVGLVSGACFSEFGFQVICVDQDAAKIAKLNDGLIPIYEPGLEELVHTNREAGRLDFSTDLASAVAAADIVFIAVGTPARRGDGAADLIYVEQAARQIAGSLNGFTVIVTKSTVPVGTAHRISSIIGETNPDADFEIASNPEFLREGSAIEDFMRPDRVIVGVESARAAEVLGRLYRPLSLRNAPVMITGLESAELAKYAANAFLATKIAFINQIADLCEQLGADVQEVARGIGLDGRIGAKFLHPGPGFGGSCFPKDTRALAAMGKAANAPVSIVEAVISANETRKTAMARRIAEAMDNDVAGKSIAVLGVSFKPNTDDMREAPSLGFVPLLQQMGARITAYDPAAMEIARPLLPGVIWAEGAYEAAESADALVIATEWNAFRALDLEQIARSMKTPRLIDLRNVYTIEEMKMTGFTYHSIGRGPVQPGPGGKS